MVRNRRLFNHSRVCAKNAYYYRQGYSISVVSVLYGELAKSFNLPYGYADDIILIASHEEKMMELNRRKTVSQKRGLHISTAKTKIMVVETHLF